jgi:GTP-dependent phosphoenolpyruvate carboxykinase
MDISKEENEETVMGKKHLELLKAKCGQKNYAKLVQLNNPEIIHFIAKYVELCDPSSVFIRADSSEDARYIRNRAKEVGEESPLLTDGHTVHFDGYFDQARDKENTRFLITKNVDLGPDINSIDREIIYGGRDSDTWPPVFESFNWEHGVITIAASLESETTAATLGKEGVRKFNLMANLDFLSIPIGRYIQNHLDFVDDLEKPPIIFGVNYFLKDEDGSYLTGMQDKRVWLKWMELRVHNEIEALKTPIGFIPDYEDLKELFKALLNRNYTECDYLKQFILRIPQNILKIERITKIYRAKVTDAPDILFRILQIQKQRLEEVRAEYGDYVAPQVFKGYEALLK